tara:strand:- start:367 stop:507 length:141 start_codon:yes stop_codon:yes gene_type:complete
MVKARDFITEKILPHHLDSEKFREIVFEASGNLSWDIRFLLNGIKD